MKNPTRNSTILLKCLLQKFKNSLLNSNIYVYQSHNSRGKGLTASKHIVMLSARTMNYACLIALRLTKQCSDPSAVGSCRSTQLRCRE